MSIIQDLYNIYDKEYARYRTRKSSHHRLLVELRHNLAFLREGLREDLAQEAIVAGLEDTQFRAVNRAGVGLARLQRRPLAATTYAGIREFERYRAWPTTRLIEVLAFPLNSAGRPLPAESPQGRFLVDKAGYLEAREYAPGRLLEVRGQLNGFRSGQVGEVQYRYPVVVSERLLLWPGDHYGHSRRASPRVNFGIGVSNHGGGVGVGIGF